MQCDIEPLTDPLMDKLYVLSNLVPIELSGLVAVTPTATPPKASACLHEVKELLPLDDEQTAMAAKVQKTLDRIRADALKMLEG